MTERRKTKIQIGRRKSDIPIRALESFKEDMTSHLQEVIVKTVNGKIDAIKATMLTKDDFALYVKSDTQWKEDQEKKTGPVITTYNKGGTIVGFLKDSGKIIISIAAFIGSAVFIRSLFK